jgi:hypothetical protein
MTLGDFAVGATIDIHFTTRRFTTGAPFTLAGSPVISAYEDNSTTEITAGVTLVADFDARTGLNHVRVVASGANGFEAGKSYSLVITTGTVDSVSVVGEVVGYFTLERSAVFGRLGAPAGASVSADVAAVKVDIDAVPTAIENADALLKRDWTGLTGEATRSVLNALRSIRNKWSITGTTVTFTKEDDTTAAYTATLTEAVGANPYSASDPT